MTIRAKAYVGTLTDKSGKERIVSIDQDRGYVWDQLLHHFHEEHPDRPEFSTRREIIADAKQHGYRVRRAKLIMED